MKGNNNVIFKLLINITAFAILIYVPTECIVNYSNYILDFMRQITGNASDGFVKFFYILAPIIILETFLATLLLLIKNLINRFVEWNNTKRFNGFYVWNSKETVIKPGKKRTENIYLDVLYIYQNIWKYLLFMHEPTSVIKYFRYIGTKVTHKRTVFHYGLIFQREFPKHTKKNAAILIGSNVGNKDEEVLLKCELDAAIAKEGIYIDVYQPNYCASKCFAKMDKNQYQQMKGITGKAFEEKISIFLKSKGYDTESYQINTDAFKTKLIDET